MTTEEYVIREGLIFRAGSYPDKSFEMSEAEARAAVEAFSEPVPIGLEHTKNVLDSKLGHVQSIRLGEDGASIFGRISLPKWLDTLLADGERKVSAEFDRVHKTLRKLDLVLSPRVDGAAIFAAFSAAHPEAADDPDLATFTPRKTTPEATGHMQAIHDHVALLDDSLCPAAFGDRPRQIKAYAQIHSLAISNGASCPGMARMSADPAPIPKGTPMSVLTKLAAVFGKPDHGLTDDEAEGVLRTVAVGTATFAAEAAPLVVEPPAPVVAFAETPEGKAMQARIDALQAESDRNRAAAVERDAAAFAESLVGSFRLPAAFAADAAALFGRLAEDDRSASAVVTFSSGPDNAPAQGGRLDALKALFGRVPTPSESYAASLKGRAVFASDSVARSDADRDTPDPANVARLMKLAGLDG